MVRFVSVFILTASLVLSLVPVFSPMANVTDQQWPMNEGDYLVYETRFRHLMFLNGSTIDTPPEQPGTQNGTIRISAQDIDDELGIVMQFVFEIPQLFISTVSVMLDMNNQEIWDENHEGVIGLFGLWLDSTQNDVTEQITISSHYDSESNAIGTMSTISTIELASLGIHQTQMVSTTMQCEDQSLNWTSYYDLDSRLLVRLTGDPADPILLGLHGVMSLDFIITLVETNLDLGPSENTGGQQDNNGYVNYTIGTGFLGAIGILGGVAFFVSLWKHDQNNRRQKKNRLKQRRAKMKKRSSRR